MGGPPCQGFSWIRPFRTLTEGDPRNSLAEHYVLVLHRLQPAWFVFENVVGILTHERGARLDSVLEGLTGAGYQVDWRVLNAALYGVPQHRERVVIVGSRDGVPFHWPAPTHRVDYKGMAGNRAQVIRTDALFSARLPSAVTLMEAIGDLPAVSAGKSRDDYAGAPQNDYQRAMRQGSDRRVTMHTATSHSARMLEIIRHAGANINALPAGMVKSGFSSCYSRLAPDRPSTTLTVNFVHPASNRCIHPFQDRALTPREGARIQSFPDRFEFEGSSAQVVKQIGNAVPPLVGRIADRSGDPRFRGRGQTAEPRDRAGLAAPSAKSGVPCSVWWVRAAIEVDVERRERVQAGSVDDRRLPGVALGIAHVEVVGPKRARSHFPDPGDVAASILAALVPSGLVRQHVANGQMSAYRV